MAGPVLVATGIALTVWAVAALQRANTTFIPWDQVSTMVATAPFRLSRKPIYLADAIATVDLCCRYLAGTLLVRSW